MSSAKDSTHRLVGITIQGGPRGSLTVGTSPTTRASGDWEVPTTAHGSFAPLAFQPSAMANCANQQFLLSNRSIGHTFTMCCPNQTPHLTMSSAKICLPRRAFGPKRGAMPRLRFTE
ncbi:hypothetical protein Patl1_34992 [Pistacia atlantica]|uniref:Uncharacterized protein n=1 Tax=Pistacia atlantica TaxID=434234 RepID=A0ACC0ZTT2_9ROSI|nr:hypothetical protein Patl1_34992 [Pistacia atlantica]